VITKKESNFIKLLGMASMLVDHIGAFLFPVDILRIVGRLAFPLFAYQLTVGYKKTSDRKSYLKRLLIFAVISQVPYSLLKQGIELNILFTLLVGFLLIWALEKKRYCVIFALAPISIFLSYNVYGLFVILLFYFFEREDLRAGAFSVINLIFALFYQYSIQLFAVFSLIPITWPKLEIELPKYVFYVFYPLHLLIIYLIKVMMF